MSYLIGIDTGGTFTDLVVTDEKGELTTAKALSTPPNFAEGVIKALGVGAERLHITLEKLLQDTRQICFGTTVALNSFIARSGARTGLITTVGAEDTLHIARAKSKWAGLPEAEIKHMAATRKPEPFIPKELIKGVTERIDWKGSIVCPLNRDEARQAVKNLVDEGAESIAVCLLWSFTNPLHEQDLKKIISDMYPEVYSSISCEVSPLLGEYERSITTALDCYIGPITRKFLASLNNTLKTKGLKAPLLIMKADGGCAFASEVLPISTMQSGPAGGVICSRFVGEVLGYKDIITADVGGTSFDVCLLKDRAVSYAREPVVGQYNVNFPSIDIRSIGAGGGSIIWADPAVRAMHVGPRSAGSYPGPACYGFGGVEPTITDANLVLGYLNPDYFLGGKMKLNPDKAFEAIRKVAGLFGMSVTEAAAGAYDIVNSHMVDLIRAVTVERGYDPRDFVLFAFGGAGPCHAAVYGSELGVKEVIVPVAAATYSALGLAVSDILHTHMVSGYYQLPMNFDSFNKIFQDLEERAVKDLDRDGIKEDNRTLLYFLDMKYGHQYHVVRVPIPRKKYKAEEMDSIAIQFDRLYEGIYGKGAGYIPAGRYITTFVVQALGRTLKPVLRKHKVMGPDASGALKGKRNAFFREYNDYVSTDIYDWDKVQAGNIIEGPAIIEATETTIVIPPGLRGHIDTYLNVLIR